MLNAYLKEYLQYERITHSKSDNTLRDYKKDIEQLLEYLSGEGISELDNTKELNLRGFLMHMRASNVSKRSLNRKISSLKGFYRFLHLKEYVKKNIALNLENAEHKKELPSILYREEIEKIREVIKGRGLNELRDRLIIEMLYSSGIRAGELLNLSEGLIDLEEREIKVVTKNKGQRIVFFNNITKHYLHEYINTKKEKFGEDYRKDILFVNNSQNRLSDRSLRRIINRIVKRTDIKKEVSPHTFRHSFGAYMIKHGMNLHYLQELMGHTSMESTKMYLEYDIQDYIVEGKTYYNKV